jgi:hypothetical protein
MAQPNDEIRAKLEQLKKEFEAKSLLDQQKQRAAWTAEQMANKLVPGKAKGGSILKDIHAHILKTKGEHGARRVQRAADEIPGLEGMFTPEALRFTLGRSDAGLMSMDPAEFERFALRLNPSQEDLELSKIPVEYAEGMPPMSQEQYIKYLAKLKKGFNEVPFLELGQRGSEYLPSIEGHEGRHRSRAMAGKGVKKSLVQLMPSDRLRGVMPKNSSERFVEKMQQVLGDKRLVTPEGRSLLPADLSAQEHRNLENRNLLAANRPQLPEVYSDGGSTTKDMDVMRLALMKRGGKPPEVTKVTKKADDRIPELEEAARALLAGEINRTAYDKILKQFKPVRPYTSVPAPATDEEALNALYENKRDKWKANQFQAGDPVGMRLDIPSYQQHGVWVNSLHDEGGRGLPTSYAPVSSVRNAVFDAKPSQAQRVATGETKKSPFAKIKGEWHPIDEQEALAQMQEYLNHPEWHQVGMDPRRRDYFYSRKDSRKPVTHAEHVLQIGPLVLAKNPVYGKRKDFGLADGGSITHAHQLDIEERPL